MSLTRQLHPAGFPMYTLSSGDEEVVISAFGAQILSWTKSGVPIVFENKERAVLDGKTAYRGGMPICFPYFSKGALLPLGTTVAPQHGAARTSVWEELPGEELVLRTVQPTPEGYGPTLFACELTFSLGETLTVNAKIENVGESGAPFQLAVHSYWATLEPSKAVVKGLGNRFLDNLQNLTEHTEPDSSIPHEAPVDRVYLDAASQLELTTESYRLQIAAEGCANAVLWNPGPHHDLKDLGSPDFLCLECGQIVPSKTLAPGDAYRVNLSFAASF